MTLSSSSKETSGGGYCVGGAGDPGSIWGWLHDSLCRKSSETERLFSFLVSAIPFTPLSKIRVDRDTMTLE